MLCQNCFDLADSFCLYSVDETALNNAAGYFVLSGRPVSDVVQHIKNKYSDVSINKEERERESTRVCETFFSIYSHQLQLLLIF